jgi:hypothetical protein
MTMSNDNTQPVSIDIDDLEETVGGLSLDVTALNQTLVAQPIAGAGTVFFNPDTCPTKPTPGPISTCMCPGAAINPGEMYTLPGQARIG